MLNKYINQLLIYLFLKNTVYLMRNLHLNSRKKELISLLFLHLFGVIKFITPMFDGTDPVFEKGIKTPFGDGTINWTLN